MKVKNNSSAFSVGNKYVLHPQYHPTFELKVMAVAIDNLTRLITKYSLFLISSSGKKKNLKPVYSYVAVDSHQLQYHRSRNPENRFENLAVGETD